VGKMAIAPYLEDLFHIQ